MTQHSFPIDKSGLHPRNQHRQRYDFALLIKAHPALAGFVRRNQYQDDSIDFADALAVKTLNQALLKHYYGIAEWDIPPQFLCPPIPGRADYVHCLADLLVAGNSGEMPYVGNVRVLDIGTGANLVYPIIGQREYGWHFVGTDINAEALENAQRIVAANPVLAGTVELRLQHNVGAVFPGVMQEHEHFDLTMCNPPFHTSQAAAMAGTQRKWQNLERSRGKHAGKDRQPIRVDQKPGNRLNFGGQAAELYCEGGEEAFIGRMVKESLAVGAQCLWFTTLVSKVATLPAVYRSLRAVNACKVKTIEMAQGQKKSRFVAWTFHDQASQRAWSRQYWRDA